MWPTPFQAWARAGARNRAGRMSRAGMRTGLLLDCLDPGGGPSARPPATDQAPPLYPGHRIGRIRTRVFATAAGYSATPRSPRRPWTPVSAVPRDETRHVTGPSDHGRLTGTHSRTAFLATGRG